MSAPEDHWGETPADRDHWGETPADRDHWGETPADRDWRIQREFQDAGFSGSDDFEAQLQALMEDHSEAEAIAILLARASKPSAPKPTPTT